jgi:hypothetical protein
MDPRLKAALEFSDYRQTVNQQRQQLKDRIDAELTYGHNGGFFKIDRSLLTFLDLLISKDRTKNIPLFDLNQNPIMIADVVSFRDDIFDRYMTLAHASYLEYENIKKSRTVKKLLDI